MAPQLAPGHTMACDGQATTSTSTPQPQVSCPGAPSELAAAQSPKDPITLQHPASSVSLSCAYPSPSSMTKAPRCAYETSHSSCFGAWWATILAGWASELGAH